MAEPSSSPSEASDEERTLPHEARLGRNIAIIIVWIAIVYLAIVGFNAVIRGVFFPEEDALAQELGPLGAEECKEQALELRDELLGEASEAVRRAESVTLEAFFTDWDHRFKITRARCETNPLPKELERLRYSLGTMLKRFDKREGAYAREILRALGERNEHQK